MNTSSIPRGPSPYLFVPNVDKIMGFLTHAFGATQLYRVYRGDGSVLDAEVQIGSSVVMLGEPWPAATFPPTPGMIYLYVEDCDNAYQRALEAGAISVMEPSLKPNCGDRYGGVRDQGGNIWWIATRVEDLSPEEQQRRAQELAL